MARTITYLNRTGDQTIAWTPDRDEAFREYIEKLMAAGYTFFILRPTMGGEVEQVRVKSFAKAVEAGRQIVLTDRDFDEIIAGAFEFIDPPEDLAASVEDNGGIARTPDEVLRNDTAAVRPMQGG